MKAQNGDRGGGRPPSFPSSFPPPFPGGHTSKLLHIIMHSHSSLPSLPSPLPPFFPPSLPCPGYPRHSGIVREDQIFTAEDHHKVTLAADKYGANFEAVAREVGRPQWAIAAFHEWQNYIFGVWFIYQVVELGRERRWSEAEITRAIGTNVQMLYDGTW